MVKQLNHYCFREHMHCSHANHKGQCSLVKCEMIDLVNNAIIFESKEETKQKEYLIRYPL